MAIEHPYVHAWFGAGGEEILQVLRGDEATHRVVRVYKANKPLVCFARRYALMVLHAGADCVPMPKTIRERDETGERSVSLSKRVVVQHTACVQ